MIIKIRQKISLGILTIAISLMGILAVPQKIQAAAVAWPDLIGFSYGHALDVAWDTFKGTMLANLKMMASRLITDRLQALLTGTAPGSALYITNYQNFIYASSQNQTQLYMDSFFNSLASGASATTGEMLNGVKSAVTNEVINQGMGAQTTIDKYVNGGIQNVFNQSNGGGYKAFMEALHNPYNNYYGAYLSSSQVAMNQMAMNQDLLRTQAIANRGFISPVDPKTNQIKTPGALIADLTAKVQSLPMEIMAYAQHIPEVIGTMAAQILTQTIESGISKVTQPIDNQLIQANQAVNGGIYNIQEQVYKGIKFSSPTSTPTPPAPTPPK